MLKVSILDMCFMGFSESLLLVWAISLINMKKLNIKIWILLSIFFTIIVYFLRMLPIQYGAHTLISVAILIVNAHYINKTPLIKSISSSLIVVILLFICEFVNIVLLMYLFKVNIQKMVNLPLQKTIVVLPSLMLFVIFILIFNNVNKKNIMKGNI